MEEAGTWAKALVNYRPRLALTKRSSILAYAISGDHIRRLKLSEVMVPEA